jgi:hypothetical protein
MMDLFVSVPKDFSRIKTKVVFNLTLRQIICFAIAAAVGLPVFFLVKRGGNVSLASLCMIAVMMPFFFLAMYEKDGMPLEVLIRHYIDARLIRPKVRYFETDNLYTALVRQYEAERKINEIIRISEQKAKGKNRTEAAGSRVKGRPAKN